MLNGALHLRVSGNVHAQLTQRCSIIAPQRLGLFAIRLNQGVNDLADVPLVDCSRVMQAGDDRSQRQHGDSVHIDSRRACVEASTMAEAGASSSRLGGGLAQ